MRRETVEWSMPSFFAASTRPWLRVSSRNTRTLSQSSMLVSLCIFAKDYAWLLAARVCLHCLAQHHRATSLADRTIRSQRALALQYLARFSCQAQVKVAAQVFAIGVQRDEGTARLARYVRAGAGRDFHRQESLARRDLVHGGGFIDFIEHGAKEAIRASRTGFIELGPPETPADAVFIVAAREQHRHVALAQARGFGDVCCHHVLAEIARALLVAKAAY